MNKSTTEHRKRSLYLEITVDELCTLMTHARKTGVAEFKLDGLQFKMGPLADEITIAKENPTRLAEDFGSEVMRQKVMEADEMLISNPEAYEEAIEKAIRQEALPVDNPSPTSEAK